MVLVEVLSQDMAYENHVNTVDVHSPTSPMLQGLVSWLFLLAQEHIPKHSWWHSAKRHPYIHLCVFVVEILFSMSSKRAGVGFRFAHLVSLAPSMSWPIVGVQRAFME